MTDKETSAAAETAAASTVNPPPAPAAEAIEEDDEFEEFEPCHWDKRDEDAEDSQQWQVSYSMIYVGGAVANINIHVICHFSGHEQDVIANLGTS